MIDPKHDMTVPCHGGIINIRAGAIIMKNGKILMVENCRSDYLYSVGGRLKFGETAEEAVLREVEEETGVRLEIDRLGFVHENYFWGDSPVKKGQLVYELSYFFYMKTPGDFEPICESITEDGVTERLRWISPNDPIKYYPEFFRTELAHPTDRVKFFTTDDR